MNLFLAFDIYNVIYIDRNIPVDHFLKTLYIYFNMAMCWSFYKKTRCFFHFDPIIHFR